MLTCDVAIIGAGPYGLSAAAHLRAVKGLDVRLFGEPMSFWERNMPAGMLLRSPWSASHISDPSGALTLDAYRSPSGGPLPAPVPLDGFIDYGRWFQRQASPDVDKRMVTGIERNPAGFRLTLEDGDALKSRRVVVAAGIGSFAQRPPQFDHIPSSLAFHSSEHSDLSRFAGRRIVVVGAGQSAFESAALLKEAGADVEIIARASEPRWLARSARLHGLGFLSKLLYAPTDIGPAGVSRLVAAPNLYRRLPRDLQDKLRVRSIRPAAAHWLRPRLSTVRMTMGRSVIAAIPGAGGVRIRLDDGGERFADHVLLGTGYRVDISRYSFLGPDLLRTLRCAGGFPRLTRGFESSIPGLHFVGAPAAWSFGPLLCFVAGVSFASCELTRCISSATSLRGRERKTSPARNAMALE